ncbi:Aldo/keto reductase [Mycena olivaceomarginata]|nr:Aldo/keto reductase [Mycena olivaceomarginata]
MVNHTYIDQSINSTPSPVRLGNSGLEESIKHIKYAYEAGIQTFDAANMYANGLSEIVLGNAIKKLQLPREEIVVMIKVSLLVTRRHSGGANLFFAGPDTLGYVNQHRLSRKNILASVQDSLKRLQLDYIDLLQCHRFDYETPIAETMEALHEVVKAGYVRYIGMSSCHAWYSSLRRGFIPWSLLARGALTRPAGTATSAAEKSVRQESDELSPDVYLTLGAGSKDIVDRVEEIARKHGATMAQVSLAWLMAKEEVTAPIVGTTSLEKLEDLLSAIDVKLTPEEIAYLEEPYKPMKIFMYN